MGFNLFAPTSRTTVPLLPRCKKCGLKRSCASPKMKVDGKGKRKILVVGEAPGKTEDQTGKPFVGSSGQLLEQKLAECGVDLRRDCWITNSIICRSHDDKDRNRTPTDAEVDHCRPNLVNTIKELQPDKILLFGASAVRSVLGWLYKGSSEELDIARWLGWRIPSQKLNAWICPNWHPAFLQHAREEGFGRENQLRDRMFMNILRSACELEGKPYGRETPNYARGVEVQVDPDRAAIGIGAILALGDPVAFDYETDRLKPDHPDSRIVCCAVSNGINTIAYPWHGEAIRATKELLRSDVPKIAANAKFEERYSIRHLGCRVRNWQWDTMLAAHILDCRKRISGLKFQAFVNFGVEPYDDYVSSYLEGKTANSENRIRAADPYRVLQYCGMDAFLEWKLAQVQMNLLGYK